jgi:hypothetical protein
MGEHGPFGRRPPANPGTKKMGSGAYGPGGVQGQRPWPSVVNLKR